jgi:hypothetical protein
MSLSESWFKENLVPSESSSNKLPEEALNAFLDGILSELSAPSDPDMLTSVRSIFRKRIPLHMRSYAAALLILRAAGMTRTPQARPQDKPRQAPAPRKREAAEPAAKSPESAGGRPEPRSRTRQAGQDDASRNRRGPENTVPLFVSAGKRQRLRPQDLRMLISEKSGIQSENLGRVHLFDNYSFIDVPQADAERIVAACEGAEMKGRPIEIKPAKKRPEAGAEMDQAE